MTDEMRAAESLVRNCAPTGIDVPIPEPLAVDESAWLLTAVDKGLVEFTHCTDACTRRARTRTSARDHFEIDRRGAHHLFAVVDREGLALHREYVTAIAAYARAVLDFGYDVERSSWLRDHEIGHRLATRFASAKVRSDAEFLASDGSVQLQIKSARGRQHARRLANALDAHGSLSALPREVAREFNSVVPVNPRFLWLVGPNTVEPVNHVYRVKVAGDDATFRRVDAVPLPA